MAQIFSKPEILRYKCNSSTLPLYYLWIRSHWCVIPRAYTIVKKRVGMTTNNKMKVFYLICNLYIHLVSNVTYQSKYFHLLFLQNFYFLSNALNLVQNLYFTWSGDCSCFVVTTPITPIFTSSTVYTICFNTVMLSFANTGSSLVSRLVPNTVTFAFCILT
uniref:Putative 5'-nucleotidase/apyrase n=1 Tax=Ixodes ricinus TaxID=34613 RepID=A0A0K8RH97_IXORI